MNKILDKMTALLEKEQLGKDFYRVGD
jgi:hypothetical protein